MSAGNDRYYLSEAEKKQFHEEGYLIAKGLFQPDEVAEIKETFMRIQAEGVLPGYFEPASPEEAKGDPLKLFPRILYPHRVIGRAKSYMLHPPVMALLKELFQEEALAAQSMFYFKPPGGRGQALHQDNYYLRVEPGTCIAAWTAIDPADQENGGLVIVPRTQNLDIECPHEADPALSYFRDEVNLPEGGRIVPVDMEAGDVLFFNGSTIHGSYPNRSAERFRRSFICHYVGSSTLRIGYHIHDDLYNGQGEVVNRAKTESPGACGNEFEGAPH